MNEKATLKEIVLGKTSWEVVRFLATLAGIGIFAGGFVLIMQGIVDQGTIDIKMAFVEGKLQTGSVGLLFSFLGVILLLACLFSKTTSRLKIIRKRDGSLSITHSGVFMKSKADAIATVLQADSQRNQDSVNTQPTDGQVFSESAPCASSEKPSS